MATLAKPLNDLGRNHWENFASANYFDDSGLFIVSIYALPLVFNSFVTLVSLSCKKKVISFLFILQII